MKRSAASTAPQRNSGFISQKKVRTMLDYIKKGENKTVTPLNERGTPIIIDDEDVPLLTGALRFAMASSVRYQLDVFKMTQTGPLECALNKEHGEEGDEEFVVAYHIRYFDDLCNAFLKMFSSFKRPTEFSEETGDFLLADDTFNLEWVHFHQKRASLRILCHSCHMTHYPTKVAKPQFKAKGKSNCCINEIPPLPGYNIKSINDILKPYKGGTRLYEHPWLDLSTWGERTDKGNYTRKLGEKLFTLFMKDSQWHYVYNNQFSKEGYHCLKDILQATYELYGDTIRRFV